MHVFVLTATYELRVSRKSHLRDHPSLACRYNKPMHAGLDFTLFPSQGSMNLATELLYILCTVQL